MEKDTAYKTFEISPDTPMAAINKLYLQKSEYYAKQLEDLKNLSYLSAEQTKLSSKLSLLNEAYIALGGYIDKSPIQQIKEEHKSSIGIGKKIYGIFKKNNNPVEKIKIPTKQNLLINCLRFVSNSKNKLGLSIQIASKHINSSSNLEAFVKTTKYRYHYYVLFVGLTLFICSFFLPVKNNIEYGYIAAGIVLDYDFENSRPLSHFFVYIFYNFSNLSVILMLIFGKKKYYKNYVLGIPILGIFSTNYWWILSSIGNLYSGYWFWVVGQFLISFFFIVNLKINKNTRRQSDKTLNIAPKEVSEYYKKNNASWGRNIIIFLLGIVVIGTIGYYSYAARNKQKDSLSKAKTIELETQISNLQEQKKAFQLRYENAESKLEEVAKEVPFIISSITFENSVEDGDYKKVFKKDKVRSIAPILTIIKIANNWNDKIKIKYIEPDGTLSEGEKSPSGFSFDYDLTLKSSTNEIISLDSWGNEESATYSSGSYKVEIWWNNKMLGKETFKIEE